MKGFHLISTIIFEVLPKITGVVHVFMRHTSASLTINENADPRVRDDFALILGDMLVSENDTYYKHTFEGLDDMTSHIKSSLFGSSVSFPIRNGVPLFGTWQGIYLCVHSNRGGRRNIYY